MVIIHIIFFFFFFNDTATTEIYTLSLHDALPIWGTLSAPYARAAAAVFGRASIPTGARDQSRQTDFRHGEVTAPRNTLAPDVAAHDRSRSLFWFLVLLVAAALVGIAAAKVTVRRLCYVSRDPRRIAA